MYKRQGPDKAEETLDDYIKILQRAKSLNIPMLCTNPDKMVLHGNTTHMCAGYLAAYYSSIGGVVSYIGKPVSYTHLTLPKILRV